MQTRYVTGAELLPAFGLQPGQDILFTHAHPDDESVATGHAISQLQANGVNVHVALATDGTASTLGNPALVNSGGRRAEAEKALLALDVPLDQQHYLDLADGKLGKASYEALVQRIGSLLAGETFAAMFTPGKEGFDGHTDHIAVHQATLQAVNTLTVPPPIWELVRDKGIVAVGAGTTKIQAIEQHASQYPNGVETDILKPEPYPTLIFAGEQYRRVTLPARK